MHRNSRRRLADHPLFGINSSSRRDAGNDIDRSFRWQNLGESSCHDGNESARIAGDENISVRLNYVARVRNRCGRRWLLNSGNAAGRTRVFWLRPPRLLPSRWRHARTDSPLPSQTPSHSAAERPPTRAQADSATIWRHVTATPASSARRSSPTIRTRGSPTKAGRTTALRSAPMPGPARGLTSDWTGIGGQVGASYGVYGWIGTD